MRAAAIRGLRRSVRDAGAASPLADDKHAPNGIRAQALLIVARADDLAEQRDQTKRGYQRIVGDYEHESASWPAKAGLVSPYRPH